MKPIDVKTLSKKSWVAKYASMFLFAFLVACATSGNLVLQGISFYNSGDEPIYDVQVNYGDIEIKDAGPVKKSGRETNSYNAYRPIQKDISVSWRTEGGATIKRTVPVAAHVNADERFVGLRVNINQDQLVLYKIIGHGPQISPSRDVRIYP